MGRYRTQADCATSATQADCYSVGSCGGPPTRRMHRRLPLVAPCRAVPLIAAAPAGRHLPDLTAEQYLVIYEGVRASRAWPS